MALQKTTSEAIMLVVFLSAAVQALASDPTCSPGSSECVVGEGSSPSDLSGLIQMRMQPSEASEDANKEAVLLEEDGLNGDTDELLDEDVAEDTDELLDEDVAESGDTDELLDEDVTEGDDELRTISGGGDSKKSKKSKKKCTQPCQVDVGVMDGIKQCWEKGWGEACKKAVIGECRKACKRGCRRPCMKMLYDLGQQS